MLSILIDAVNNQYRVADPDGSLQSYMDLIGSNNLVMSLCSINGKDYGVMHADNNAEDHEPLSAINEDGSVVLYGNLLILNIDNARVREAALTVKDVIRIGERFATAQEPEELAGIKVVLLGNDDLKEASA